MGAEEEEIFLSLEGVGADHPGEGWIGGGAGPGVEVIFPKGGGVEVGGGDLEASFSGWPIEGGGAAESRDPDHGGRR